MTQAPQECPECGRAMDYRLGAWECPGCGRLALVQPLDEPEAPPDRSDDHAGQPDLPPPPVRIDWAKGEVHAAPELLPPPPVSLESSGSAARLLSAGGHAVAGHAAPLPADGNTSGMGPGFPLPDEARGWTNAGVVPAGLFSFYNGSLLWGIVGALGVFFGLAGLAYFVAVGLRGKEDAWRGRRFASIDEYVAVMAAWDRAGVILIWVTVALLAIGGAVLIAWLRRVFAEYGLEPGAY
jgi:hypothetical protein